jgi:hypothetical protein
VYTVRFVDRCVSETHLPSSHSIALQIVQANGIISGKYCNWGKQSREKVVLIIWRVLDGAHRRKGKEDIQSQRRGQNMSSGGFELPTLPK